MKANGQTFQSSGKLSWGLLFVLCGAIFLEGIDVSMMGVALPAIRAELGMSTGSLQWVVSAYVLGYGGFMLLGGRAADLFGRKKMFLLWLTVFFAFSGLGGLSTEGWMLITARFVTGISAAFMTPAGLSIITTSFAEGTARNKALLVYAGTAAAGFSLGLVVGGILSEISWRWVFFGPVLLAFVILLAAIRLIPALRSAGGILQRLRSGRGNQRHGSHAASGLRCRGILQPGLELDHRNISLQCSAFWSLRND